MATVFDVINTELNKATVTKYILKKRSPWTTLHVNVGEQDLQVQALSPGSSRPYSDLKYQKYARIQSTVA